MQASLTISATAIGAALATLQAADANASTVKFSAMIDFTVIVGASVRRQINTGSNLETDGKGRFVAVLDGAKEARKALVAGLIAAGVKDKDAENIGSLAATSSRYFVTAAVNSYALQSAKSEQDMRDNFAESFLQVCGGDATYNALEKARSRKFAAPEPVAEQEPEAVAPEEAADPFAVETMGPGIEAPEAAPQSEPEAAPDLIGDALAALGTIDQAQLLADDRVAAFVASYLATKRAANKEARQAA